MNHKGKGACSFFVKRKTGKKKGVNFSQRQQRENGTPTSSGKKKAFPSSPATGRGYGIYNFSWKEGPHLSLSKKKKRGGRGERLLSISAPTRKWTENLSIAGRL